MKKPPGNWIYSWQQQRLLDTAIDAYADWRDECRAVWDAHRRWTSAPVADAGFAFDGYSAALEREECAAAVYAALMRRVANEIRTELDHPPGPTQPAPGDLQHGRNGP